MQKKRQLSVEELHGARLRVHIHTLARGGVNFTVAQDWKSV